MVAPSFATFIQLCEPFTENGKSYVKVRNPKTLTERKVRWYSDLEYAKAYPSAVKTSDFRGLKSCRGFSKGPILVIRNNKSEDEDFLRRSVARYAVGIGWYIASEDTLPTDAPPHFKYLLLSWDEFKDTDDEHMKDSSTLAALLNRKAYDKEWINLT